MTACSSLSILWCAAERVKSLDAAFHAEPGDEADRRADDRRAGHQLHYLDEDLSAGLLIRKVSGIFTERLRFLVRLFAIL